MSRFREEYEIQIALVGHILLRAVPGLVWTATANGELRDPAVGAKLKRMGVKAGVPDLYFAVPCCAPFWLELKTIGGRLSEAQKEFIPALLAVGVPVFVAYGLDEALSILEREGAISPTAEIAPNPRNAGAGVGVGANQLVPPPRSATRQRRPSDALSTQGGEMHEEDTTAPRAAAKRPSLAHRQPPETSPAMEAPQRRRGRLSPSANRLATTPKNGSSEPTGCPLGGVEKVGKSYFKAETIEKTNACGKKGVVTKAKRPSPKASSVDSDAAVRNAIASRLGIDPGRVHLHGR